MVVAVVVTGTVGSRLHRGGVARCRQGDGAQHHGACGGRSCVELAVVHKGVPSVGRAWECTLYEGFVAGVAPDGSAWWEHLWFVVAGGARRSDRTPGLR